MCDNCISHPVNLNAPYDIPFESTISALAENPCYKQMKIEKELSLDSDTDFQSFLLPLEQDLTKSSKGYASLLSATSAKEIKFIDYKNKFERTEGNMLPSNNFSYNDYLRNTSGKCLHSNSDDHGNSKNADYLLNEMCTKFNHNTLKSVTDDQIDESVFSKTHTKIIHNYPQNSHNDDHISETKENIVHLDKCIKTTHGLSNLFNLGRFGSKSSDDDSSWSSETDIFFNVCNNSINFNDDFSSDNSILMFSEEEKITKWFSNIEIKQTFITTINSESSNADYDCFKESGERKTSIFSEDFEFGSVNLLENLMPSQRNLYTPIIPVSSEGYINESFEDTDFLVQKSSFLKDINDSWNDLMKNISGEPRESKRVSFVPLPDLISVFHYEREDVDYRYSLYVLDQLRFQNRIKDFEYVITPYLTPEHRASIFRRNCLQD